MMTMEQMREATVIGQRLGKVISAIENLEGYKPYHIRQERVHYTTIELFWEKFELVATDELIESIILHAREQALELCARGERAGMDTTEFRDRLAKAMESSCVSG